MTITNTLRRGTATLALVAASFGMASLATAGEKSYGSGASYAKDAGTIVDAAVATDDLSTLVKPKTLSQQRPQMVVKPKSQRSAVQN